MDKKVPKRKHAGGRPRSHASGIQTGYAVKLNPVEAVIVRAVGEGSVYRGLRRLVAAYVKQAEVESIRAGLAAGGGIEPAIAEPTTYPIESAPKDGSSIFGQDIVGCWHVCWRIGDEEYGQWICPAGYDHSLVAWIPVPAPKSKPVPQ